MNTGTPSTNADAMAPAATPHDSDARRRFHDILKSFSTAMLVTKNRVPEFRFLTKRVFQNCQQPRVQKQIP